MTAVAASAARMARLKSPVCRVAVLASICFSMTLYATVAICTAVRATMNTPPAIPTPIASHTRIAISTDMRSFSSREPALEGLERDIGRHDRPIRRAREVVRERRPGDEWREVRADRPG